MFNGKAIYNPSGKAGEYSHWACNFYVGCSNNCSYCYLKKGRGAKVLGGNKPRLKKCFHDAVHAMEIFEKELVNNLDDIREHGLFFSFTTDPMLEETADLTVDAITVCQDYQVPVKVLTKRTDRLFMLDPLHKWKRDLVAIGFTLTGRDILEPNATPNLLRCQTMKLLNQNGFKTFASIEPIIDFWDSKCMISFVYGCCDLIKVGLESGGRYDVVEAQSFVEWLNDEVVDGPKIYLKESLQKLTGYTNKELGGQFVERDYNMFQ